MPSGDGGSPQQQQQQSSSSSEDQQNTFDPDESGLFLSQYGDYRQEIPWGTSPYALINSKPLIITDMNPRQQEILALASRDFDHVFPHVIKALPNELGLDEWYRPPRSRTRAARPQVRHHHNEYELQSDSDKSHNQDKFSRAMNQSGGKDGKGGKQRQQFTPEQLAEQAQWDFQQKFSNDLSKLQDKHDFIDGVQEVGEQVREKVADGVEKLAEGMDKAGKDIKQAVGNVKKDVKKAAKGVERDVKSAAKEVESGVKNAVEDIQVKLHEAGEDMYTASHEALNEAQVAAKQATKDLKKLNRNTDGAVSSAISKLIPDFNPWELEQEGDLFKSISQGLPSQIKSQNDHNVLDKDSIIIPSYSTAPTAIDKEKYPPPNRKYPPPNGQQRNVMASLVEPSDFQFLFESFGQMREEWGRRHGSGLMNVLWGARDGLGQDQEEQRKKKTNAFLSWVQTKHSNDNGK